jgi:hypothetical protein
LSTGKSTAFSSAPWPLTSQATTRQAYMHLSKSRPNRKAAVRPR